jgi:hypothetical protein
MNRISATSERSLKFLSLWPKKLSADADTVDDSARCNGGNDDGSRNGYWPTHCNGTIWPDATCPNNTGGTDDRMGGSRVDSNRSSEGNDDGCQDQKRTHEWLP